MYVKNKRNNVKNFWINISPEYKNTMSDLSTKNVFPYVLWGAESIYEVKIGSFPGLFCLNIILLSENPGNQGKAHPNEIIWMV